MKDINYKDIRELKTFEKYGDVFTQEKYNPNTGMFLYKRTNKEDPTKISYEVVKGRRRKLPEGKEVLTYPVTSDWGIYGLSIGDNKYAGALIDYFMGHGITSPEERYNFKKELMALPF